MGPRGKMAVIACMPLQGFVEPSTLSFAAALS